MFFDEFSLARFRPTHYAWSPRNQRPQIPSDEAHRHHRLNGLLAVDARSGETFLDFRERSAARTVAEYLVVLCLRLSGRGYQTIRLILDKCAAHHAKMRQHFHKVLDYIVQDLCSIAAPAIHFIHTPVYSPQLNLAEYFINHLRQAALYHTPPTMTVQQKADRMLTKLKQKPLQTPEQTQNTLRYIYKQVKL